MVITMDIEQTKQYGNGGYQVTGDEQYSFYAVYWQEIANHYVVQEQYRLRQHNRKLPTKPIDGPYVVGVLELDGGEESVDQRCLRIIREKFPERKRIIREVVREVVAELE